MIEEPAYAALCRDILSIGMKKQPQVPPRYLSIDELKLLLNMPDRASPQGRRDIVLLTLLYDTAARVQELIDLQVGDIQFQKLPHRDPSREGKQNPHRSNYARNRQNGRGLH